MNKAERFPLPAVSEGLDFGARFRTGAFPTFISFDAQVTEALPFPGSFPNSKRKKVRVGPLRFISLSSTILLTVREPPGTCNLEGFSTILQRPYAVSFEIEY